MTQKFKENWKHKPELAPVDPRITELEATNAALVEFIAADEALMSEYLFPTESPFEEHYQRLLELSERKRAIRQTLATDHSIPLPGEGVERG